jgi:hypothetical protein
MTDQQLRDELSRIAETAPELRVPDGLYTRGRRVHRRSVAIVTASVTAAVTLIIVGVFGFPDRQSDIEPAERNVDLAVPEYVETAPEWLAELDGLGSYAHADALEDDLDISTGAVAYVRTNGNQNGSVPVVVDATEGDYHVLDLDGFVGKQVRGKPSDSAVALSPDGRHLAWGWADPPGGDSAPRPGGVKVADLTTGAVRTWDVTAQQNAAVYVHNLEWSTNGRWLLWQGWQMRSWEGRTFDAETSIAGSIGLEDDGFLFADQRTADADAQNREVGLSRELEWAISDNGTIARLGDGDVLTQAPGADLESQPLTTLTSGTYIGLSFRGAELNVIKRLGGTEVIPLDGRTPGLMVAVSEYSRLMGWIDTDPIFQVDVGDGLVGNHQFWAPDGETSLVAMDRSIAEGATIAYRLIDPGAIKATVVRPDPTWPEPSSGLGLPMFGLIITAGFALLLAPFVVRRRQFSAARKAG